jgi:gliding motility-associated-like protein
MITFRSYAQFDGVAFKDSTYIATFQHFFVPQALNNGDTVNFPKDTTHYSFYWTSDGDNISPRTVLTDTKFYFSHVFDSEGSYNVMLEVKNDTAGTSFFTTQTISVKDPIEVPNVFTPDGDNINDLFVVKSSGDADNKLKLSIYTRNGELVHEQIARVVYWDGKLASGQYASEGVYYYIISSQGTPSRTKKGFFHLFR